MWKKCDSMSICLDTVLALDSETYAQTELVKQYHTLHARACWREIKKTAPIICKLSLSLSLSLSPHVPFGLSLRYAPCMISISVTDKPSIHLYVLLTASGTSSSAGTQPIRSLTQIHSMPLRTLMSWTQSCVHVCVSVQIKVILVTAAYHMIKFYDQTGQLFGQNAYNDKLRAVWIASRIDDPGYDHQIREFLCLRQRMHSNKCHSICVWLCHKEDRRVLKFWPSHLEFSQFRSKSVLQCRHRDMK